jgi:hypothetical protein
MSTRRGVLSLVASLLGAIAAAVSLPASSAASVDTVRGGESGLHVPFANYVELGNAGIFVTPTRPAFLTFRSIAEGPVLHFPISDGTVESDTMLGTVNHQGGFLMQKIDSEGTVSAELDVKNLRILNGNMLVGDTAGLPVPGPTADLVNSTHSKDASTGVIHYEADAQVNAVMATVLNTYFSTSVFQDGMILGRLKSDINTLGHVRPVAATPMLLSLVPAYAACAAANRVHGPPLESPSCAPPAQRSSELTVGTADANGEDPNFVGSVEMRVMTGNPLTTDDEADVRLRADLSDVRRKSDLGDYEGELEVRTIVRLTDRLNGSGLTESTTMRNFQFEFVAPCTPTAGGSGSDCSVSTTADAVTPGLIDEGARAVWQLGQVSVADGGSDGVASTEPNGVFAVQGVFVP